MILVALAALVLVFLACAAIAQTLRCRSAPHTALVGAAFLVCVEAVIMRGLSVARALTGPLLLAANLAFVAGTALWLLLARRRVRLPRAPRWSASTDLYIPVIIILVVVSAVAYLPSTHDSMTYHLARVAHWLQNRSVEPYPTNIMRQVVIPPGGDYLLLFLQAISRSDRSANFVQLGCWLLLILAATPMARLFGAPRSIARHAGLLAAATPMAVLQASSTQNDLIAATMSAAVVLAAVPFLHRSMRWRAGDVVSLGAAGIAGLLVKPTSLIVAAPILAWVAWARWRDFGVGTAWRRFARGLAVVAGLGTATLGPVLAQALPAHSHEGVALLADYVYPGTGEYGDRAQNVVRGVLRNLPIPLAVVNRLAPEKTVGCPRANDLCLLGNLAPSEGRVASVGPMLVFLVALGLFFVPRRAPPVPARARLALVCWTLAWIVFHSLFRDNVWITRLQLPLLMLSPLALGLFPARPGFARSLLTVLMIAAMAQSAVAAAQNTSRPLDPVKMLHTQGPDAYYVNGSDEARRAHARVLQVLAVTGCRRLGLFIGENSYDYPLTWRAMRQGIEVRHVTAPDPWACAVFGDREVDAVSWRVRRVQEGSSWMWVANDEPNGQGN